MNAPIARPNGEPDPRRLPAVGDTLGRAPVCRTHGRQAVRPDDSDTPTPETIGHHDEELARNFLQQRAENRRGVLLYSGVRQRQPRQDAIGPETSRTVIPSGASICVVVTGSVPSGSQS